jgi:hypothetical protein
MSKWYVLDENKQPVETTLDGWTKWMSADSGRNRVAETALLEGVYVSTIFMGTQYPMLFETMVFADDEMKAGWSRRYATWDDAVAGHKQAVAVTRRALLKVVK